MPIPPIQSRDDLTDGSRTMGIRCSAPLVLSEYSNSFLRQSAAPFLPAMRSMERCVTNTSTRSESSMAAHVVSSTLPSKLSESNQQ